MEVDLGIHGVNRGEPMAQDVDQKQLRKLVAEKLPHEKSRGGTTFRAAPCSA
jgi:hypothetical protein